MSETVHKPTLYSAVQPSGTITIGNYIGAIRNFKLLSDEYDCLFCMADLHSLTVRQNPADLRRRTAELAALYIACGLDPEKNIIYAQSHVHQHAELAWILNCFTYMGELNRMTQFKEKSLKHADNINAGLFTYPVLMAADILLYQTNVVPVGADQKQHLEIARDIANRFNGIYGKTFTIPDPYIGKSGARVMSLQDPTKKMSKSDPNPKSYISVFDTPEQIMKKIKSAVTDSEGGVYYGEGKEGVNNLMSIYSCCTGLTNEQIEAEFQGKGYGDFKVAVAESVIEELRPVREKFDYYMKDTAELKNLQAKGAETANRIADRTLTKVMKKVGFVIP